MLSVTWIEPLGWMLVHSVWLISLIVGVAAIAFAGLRRRSANARYVTGCVALLLSLATLPSSFVWVTATREVVPAKSFDNAQSGWHALTIGKGVGDESEQSDQGVAEVARDRDEVPGSSDRSLTTAATESVASADVEIVAASTPSVWQRIESQLRPHLSKLVAVWLVGVVVLSLRPLIGWRASRLLRRVGLSDVPEFVTKTLTELSTRLGMRRTIQICQSSLVQIPCVIGSLKPLILLPASAITGLSAEQLEAVLAHELAHVRRHDYLVNVLQTLVETICFYHPAVWWLSCQIRIEREHCCDDVVLTLLNDRAEYCRALVAIEELRGRSTLLAIGVTDGSLLARVRRIVGVAPDGAAARLSDRWPVAFVGLVTLGIVLTITLGTLTSSRAENEKPVAERGPEESQRPKAGAKLKTEIEERLQWGEPVNGLRMSLAWPPTLGEVAIGDEPEFYLVVQNVSEAAVRLTANDAAPNPRRMTLWNNGTPISATADDSLMPGDWLLQPREVAWLRMFRPTEKLSDGRTLSAAKEQVVRVYPQYSFTAEMTIEKAPRGAWTGKLTTGESHGSFDVKLPKHKGAEALFKSWHAVSRLDGKIPGGVIGQLAESVKLFTEYNPTWKTTPELLKMLPRFDATRDWGRAEAVALLDELAALQDTPLSMAMDREYERTVHTGAALPPDLEKSPWGQTLPNGLRLAWRLEPRVLKQPLGTPLKSHVLIHNAGKEPVVFCTRTFHQGGHKARDENDAEMQVDEVEWTTLGRLLTYRLAPGEFIEVNAPGIGIGARNKDVDDWQNIRVGSWIHTKPGDVVTFVPNSVQLSDWNEKPSPDGPPRWWIDLITARLSRHLPFPADADARDRLLHQVAIEVLGTSLLAKENAAFVDDHEPTAVDSAAKRLASRAGITTFTGSLQSGSTKFLVLPADPDAAKRPRVVSNPGWYTLGDHIRLSVTRRPVGERIVNEASIRFFSSDPKAEPPQPVELKLPEGYSTWAAAWEPGAIVLWVTQKGLVRSYDFTNPAQVKETQLAESDFDKVPKPILEALRAALDVPGAPKQVPAEPSKPAAVNDGSGDQRSDNAIGSGDARPAKQLPPLDKTAELELFASRLRSIAPKDWVVERKDRAFRLRGPEARAEKERAQILMWFDDVSIASDNLAKRDKSLPTIGAWDRTRIGRLYVNRNRTAEELWPAFGLQVRWIEPVDRLAIAGPDVLKSEIVSRAWFDAAYFRDVEIGPDGRRKSQLFDGNGVDVSISAATKFLVVGKLPDPVLATNEADRQSAQRSLTTFRELKAEAQRHGVKTITLADFEAYTQAVIKEGRGFPTHWIKDANKLQIPECLTTGAGLVVIPLNDAQSTEISPPDDGEQPDDANRDPAAGAGTKERAIARGGDQRRADADDALMIPFGAERLVEMEHGIVRVSGVDPTILNVSAEIPRQIRCRGDSLGRTEFEITDEKLQTFRVTVIVTGNNKVQADEAPLAPFKPKAKAMKLSTIAEPEKREIMVGEPTWLAFKVTNKSDKNWRMIVGGDYRNRLGRPESFSVDAFDEDGMKVPQPDAGGTLGGISVTHTLKANGESSEPFELFLPHWATITQPGRYRIVIRRKCELVPDDGSDAFRAKAEKVEVVAETALNVVPADPAKFGQLIERLGSNLLGENSADSERASKMLKAMHDERIVPWFVKLMDQPSWPRKLIACDALGQYGSDAAFAAFKKAMKTTSADIRDTTTRALAEESADQVHYSAAVALSKSPHPEAAKFLLAQATDRHWGTRITVLHFAAKLNTKEAREIIERMTRDENDAVRNEALRYRKEGQSTKDNGDASDSNAQ